MRIKSVSLSLPSWKVSNEEVVDLIQFHSKSSFSGNLKNAARKIKFILEKTGAENRYWLNKEKGEKAIDHIIKVAEDSLKKANLQKSDIDLLVYVGIGKGFLEPGNSYLVAQALGMKDVRCFDVTDACMSWLTSNQIVKGLFDTGVYKNALLINGEFTVQGGPLFQNYKLENSEQIEHTFPTYTVGEGATATVLTNDNPDNFQFGFKSRTDLADLCVIPLPEYESFCHATHKTSKNGVMKFTSYGFDLHNVAEEEAVKLIQNSSINCSDVDIVFTHASSKTEWHKYAKELGIEDRVYHIYHKTGNLVSASIPAAMALALDEGKVKEGDTMLSWVGSAGMSFGFSLGNY